MSWTSGVLQDPSLYTPFLRSYKPLQLPACGLCRLLFPSSFRDSLSPLLLLKGNRGRERHSSSFPHPSPQNQAILLCDSCHCRQLLPEKLKRMPSRANPREEENLKPLSFPIKFWIVVLLPSFDSAFLHF